MSAVLVEVGAIMVFLKYFTYFVIHCVNDCFGGTALVAAS